MPSDRYLPLPSDPPDPDFRETVAGGHALVLEYATGHALVIEYGDAEFYLRCQCERNFTLLPLRPDQPWLPKIREWVAHCPGGDRLVPVRLHCQCGVPIGSSPSPARMTREWEHVVSRSWERHTIGELNLTPADAERELRSGRYKGIAVPSSLQPVDDPAHAERLRGFREGVDAALDSVQAGVERAVAAMQHTRTPEALPAACGSDPVEEVHCMRRTLHPSHYWSQGPVRAAALYCPGRSA